MSNNEFAREVWDDENEPAASLLEVKIRRRRSEEPVYVPGFDITKPGVLELSAAKPGNDAEKKVELAEEPAEEAVDIDFETRSDTGAVADADIDLETDPAEADAGTETEPAAEADAGPEFESEAEAEAGPEFESEAEADAGPEFESEAEADAGPEFESEAEADAGRQIEPAAEAEADAGSKFESEAEADAGPEFETEAEADAGAEIEPAAEAEADAGADIDVDTRAAAAEPDTPHAGKDVEIPPKPSSREALEVEDLIECWSAQLNGKDSLPREIPVERIKRDWSNVFVLRATGWRGRKLEIVTKGNMSRGEMDLDRNSGPVAELFEMARRSVANGQPYHESVIFQSDTDETEIGLLTLPLATDGKRPDRVLCHFYRV